MSLLLSLLLTSRYWFAASSHCVSDDEVSTLTMATNPQRRLCAWDGQSDIRRIPLELQVTPLHSQPKLKILRSYSHIDQTRFVGQNLATSDHRWSFDIAAFVRYSMYQVLLAAKMTLPTIGGFASHNGLLSGYLCVARVFLPRTSRCSSRRNILSSLEL